MIAALFGEAGLVGALVSALASIAGDWLKARRHDAAIRDLAVAEQEARQRQEMLDASRRANAIQDDMRAGGYHDAVDRL